MIIANATRACGGHAGQAAQAQSWTSFSLTVVILVLQFVLAVLLLIFKHTKILDLLHIRPKPEPPVVAAAQKLVIRVDHTCNLLEDVHARISSLTPMNSSDSNHSSNIAPLAPPTP